MTNNYKNIALAFALAGLSFNAGFVHAGEGDEGSGSGVEVSKEDAQISREELLGATRQILIELGFDPANLDKAKTVKEQVEKLSPEQLQELHDRLEAQQTSLEALDTALVKQAEGQQQAGEALIQRILPLEQSGRLTQQEKKDLIENQLTAEQKAKVLANLLTEEEKQTLTNNKESAQKIVSLERVARRQNIVIGCVIGVVCIYILLQQKSVKTFLKDPKAFFATVWGYVPSKQQARSFVELCADYTTSLRDLRHPKHAWKHKGQNKLRYAVGTLATVGAIVGGTYAYSERKTIKKAGKRLWSKVSKRKP